MSAEVDLYKRLLQAGEVAVTDNAFQKLVDFLEDLGSPLADKSDDALTDSLKEAVIAASKLDAGIEYRDSSGEHNWALNVEGSFKIPLVAVVKKNQNFEHDVAVVVTVMRKEFVEKLNAEGKLGKFEPPGHTPAPVVVQDFVDARLVTWKQGKNREARTTECRASDVSDVVDNLVGLGADPQSVKIWKPVKTRLKVEMED